MKVLFCVNIPSPYRVDFFNELGKHCDLTVCFERSTSSERDSKWIGAAAKYYKAVNLNLHPFSYDRTISLGLLNYIRKSKADIIVLANYYSPSAMLAITYCRLTGKKFYMEGDGGFFEIDGFAKRWLKKWLVLGSKGYFTTCDESIKYLTYLGYDKNKIIKYPFSSIHDSEIKSANLSSCDITLLKEELNISERKVILSVGRFSYKAGYGKGYDILLDVSEKLDQDTGVYIVGDDPTEEFIRLKEEKHLDNVHYVGFRTKDILSKYYAVANCMVLLTRGDAWGLVVNEAMAKGIPVITSTRCNAGLEMIECGKNGYVVELDNVENIAEKVNSILDNGLDYYSDACIETAHKYTIETMVDAHLKEWGIKK